MKALSTAARASIAGASYGRAGGRWLEGHPTFQIRTCRTATHRRTLVSTMLEDKDVQLQSATLSIYDVYSPVRRTFLIIGGAAGVLLSFCTSIYLPALKMVQDDLHTQQELVAATVSIYMFAGGLSAVVWGPASDRFGRAPVYAAACVGYIGMCVGCMFAPTIELLLLFRALQGAIVAAFVSTALGLLADIVRPEVRGKVTGIVSIALVLGPILSPPVGGAVSQVFGWRSTFVPLAGLCLAIGLCFMFSMRHETHHYFALTRIANVDPDEARRYQEWDDVMALPPRFEAPWMPLKHLLDPAICAHAAAAIVTMGVQQCLITELPIALAAAPYFLPASLIGVALLADGTPGFISGPLGGWLSDKCAASRPNLPAARLLPNTIIMLAVGPAGVLASAWTLHTGAHLAGVLIAVGAACFGCGINLPGIFSYITTVKQSAAAAATAGIQSMMIFVSGIFVIVGSVVTGRLGHGWWFTILGCLQFVVAAVAYVAIVRQQRKLKADSGCVEVCVHAADAQVEVADANVKVVAL